MSQEDDEMDISLSPPLTSKRRLDQEDESVQSYKRMDLGDNVDGQRQQQQQQQQQIDIVNGPMNRSSEPPRTWQLSHEDAEYCLMDYVLWVQRYTAFIGLPSSTDAEIEKSRQEELVYLVNELYNIWTRGRSASRGANVIVDPQGIAYCLFVGQLVGVKLNQGIIEHKMSEFTQQIMSVIGAHQMHNFADSSIPEHNLSLSKMNSVMMATQNAYRMLLHACAMQFALNPATESIVPSKDVLFFVENFRLFKVRFEEAKPLQKLILYMIAVASQKRYRRYQNGVYAEKITEDGYRTHFWERVMSMEDFIRSECVRQNNYEMWAIHSEKRIMEAALDFLCKFHDLEFPFVRVDRHVFSFRNGIYFAANRYFRPYSSGQLNWGADSTFVSRKDILGQTNMQRRATTNSSANYFDVDFCEYPSWDVVPTPAVDKVLNDQKIPLEAQRVVWAMLGRILYEVGELDDWQVVCWMLGKANTGKSTLSKIVPLFYREEDVAILSNNVEQQFGLQGIFDKLAYIAPEVGKTFQLPQTQWQSMISGEGMSVAQKFKVAETTTWKVPGLFAGNEMPSWVDNSSSVVRRIVMVSFNETISKVDGDISKRFKMEIAQIINKANQAYHLMLKEYGSSGIWEKLPVYFKEAQSRLKAKTHPLYNFLQNKDSVIIDPESYTSLEHFRTVFRNYVQKCNLRSVAWIEEMYSVPFEDYKITIEIAPSIEWPIGSGIMVQNHTILRGVSIRDHQQQNMSQMPIMYGRSADGGPNPIHDQDGGGQHVRRNSGNSGNSLTRFGNKNNGNNGNNGNKNFGGNKNIGGGSNKTMMEPAEIPMLDLTK